MTMAVPVVVVVVVLTAMRLVEPRVAADRHHVRVRRADPNLVDGEGTRRVETDPRHETEIQVRFDRAAGGKSHSNARFLYREYPTGADRIPIKLVVIIEEPELSSRAVMKCVCVIGGNGKKVVVACIDADPVESALRESWLGCTIALDTLHFEAGCYAITIAVLITRREISVNPSANVLPFGVNRDSLDNIEARVSSDIDFDVIR
jgi:hypothetical protein